MADYWYEDWSTEELRARVEAFRSAGIEDIVFLPLIIALSERYALLAEALKAQVRVAQRELATIGEGGEEKIMMARMGHIGR